MPRLRRRGIAACRRNRLKTETARKNRIEALSNGIFAIVMTLLILELHVPTLPPTAPNVEATPALIALWPKIMSYLVAFVSLAVFVSAITSCTTRSAAPTACSSGSTSPFYVRVAASLLEERAERLSASSHRAFSLRRQSRVNRLASFLSVGLAN